MDFIMQNENLVNEWVENEEKRVENIKLPYTEQDYIRMFEEIKERILLNKLFGKTDF